MGQDCCLSEGREAPDTHQDPSWARTPLGSHQRLRSRPRVYGKSIPMMSRGDRDGLAGAGKVWPRYYCWKCLVVLYKEMLPEETLDIPVNHITEATARRRAGSRVCWAWSKSVGTCVAYVKVGCGLCALDAWSVCGMCRVQTCTHTCLLCIAGAPVWRGGVRRRVKEAGVPSP